MNIAQIRKTTERLLEGVAAAIERIEDKETQTERDEERLAALEEFADAVESALDELVSAYEG